MFTKLFFMISLLFLFGSLPREEDTYFKDFYETGKIKSEGWLRSGVKMGYWKFYHRNGRISEQGHYEYNKREKYWYFYHRNMVITKEGHYINGEMTQWWLFYNEKGRISHKCQLRKGKKNGYCLKYQNEKLTSAEKYQNGKKIKEWSTLRSFERENKLSDLK
ncbi:MAG: hypothetical protein QM485_12705 [Flavobacteriaceae bacterium]